MTEREEGEYEGNIQCGTRDPKLEDYYFNKIKTQVKQGFLEAVHKRHREFTETQKKNESHHNNDNKYSKKTENKEDSKLTTKTHSTANIAFDIAKTLVHKPTAPTQFHVPAKNAKKTAKSFEEILELKREEEKQPPKLVFLTKKQREKIQAQAKQNEREAERRKEEQDNRARRQFLMQEELDRDRERKERQKARDEERRKRDQENEALERDRKRTTKDDPDDEKPEPLSSLSALDMLSLPDGEERMRQQVRELEQIRSHYLGMRKQKKKIQKPSEKFRNIFNFEWDASEDTCRGDTNALYQDRLQPQLLFGRGFRAGIDIREQRKNNNFYDELARRRDGLAEKEKTPTALVKALDIETNDPNKVHWSSKPRCEMTERDWRIFREDYEIYIKGGRVPAPCRTWAESPLPWELIQAVNEAGYERPTAIQMQAITIAAEMRDLIGVAETGSGKTAAFVLPLLMYVKGLPQLNDETSQDGPYALILAPSRELALQIECETNKFANFCRCRAVAVVGGRNAEVQAFELRRGAEIVIGTPGRVKDSLEKAHTVLNQCNYVILDEADRMIDLGFGEVVQEILDAIPTSNLKSDNEALALEQEMQAKVGHRLYRVTHMFSATMPSTVESLARKYLRSPAYISIGDPGAGKRAIEQKLEFITEGKKKQRLQEILEQNLPPIIVFVNQKKVADVLSKALNKLGFNCVALHGGKAQTQREAALAAFKSGESEILIATDVAGRGIDVDGVQLVVNFDMPGDIEAYTHRIGRTGRAGNKGLSISFVKDDDAALFYDLKQLLNSTNNIVPQELASHPAAKFKSGPPVSSKKGVLPPC